MMSDNTVGKLFITTMNGTQQEVQVLGAIDGKRLVPVGGSGAWWWRVCDEGITWIHGRHDKDSPESSRHVVGPRVVGDGMSHNAVVTALYTRRRFSRLYLSYHEYVCVICRRRDTIIDRDDLLGVTWIYGDHDKNSPEVKAMLTAHALSRTL